jgi:hypothetical protein
MARYDLLYFSFIRAEWPFVPNFHISCRLINKNGLNTFAKQIVTVKSYGLPSCNTV